MISCEFQTCKAQKQLWAQTQMKGLSLTVLLQTSCCKITKVLILQLMKKVVVSISFLSKSSNWSMSTAKFKGKWKLKMFFPVFLGVRKRVFSFPITLYQEVKFYFFGSFNYLPYLLDLEHFKECFHFPLSPISHKWYVIDIFEMQVFS